MNGAEGCKFCNGSDALESIAQKVCDLSVTALYLMNEQSYKGRCLLVFRSHVPDLGVLDDSEAAGVMKDIRSCMRALQKIYAPDKINIGMFDDKGAHLHIHVVPKYRGSPQFGTMFELKRDAVYLKERDFLEAKARLKEALL